MIVKMVTSIMLIRSNGQLKLINVFLEAVQLVVLLMKKIYELKLQKYLKNILNYLMLELLLLIEKLKKILINLFSLFLQNYQKHLL